MHLSRICKKIILFKLKLTINTIATASCYLKINCPKISYRFYSNSCSDKNNLTKIDQNVEKYLNKLCNEHANLQQTINDSTMLNKTIKYQRINLLENIVNIYDRWKKCGKNLNAIQMEMNDEKDQEMLKMFSDEKMKYTNILEIIEKELIESLYTMTDDEQQYPSLIFEVNAGVGGQEAMLFADELHQMYYNYFDYKRWNIDVLHVDSTEIGGIRHSSQIVYGADAYDLLKYEAGVHRVQRIPTTEKSGRIHTSTVSIAVIPRPHDDDSSITINDRDLKIETKRASGAGGQHVNTTDSAVRIVHLPTGISVECQTERSQIKNKSIAIKKLQAKLLQQQMDADVAMKISTKKSQIGRQFRNEKIRTYNYNQDRITDHRIDDGTIHNLNGFLSGTDNSLDELIRKIRQSFRQQELLQIINDENK